MKANKAKELAAKYQDPKNTKEALAQLKLFANLGFTNTCFIYKKESQTKRVAKDLTKLGFKTYRESWGHKKFALHVEW